MKKSYIAIKKEIEEMKAKGFDEETIESVLRAKYNESSIERIYTEAQWEQEDKLEAIEEEVENGNKKFKVFVGVATAIIIFILVYTVVGVFVFTPNTRTNKSETPTKEGAYKAATGFVSDLLYSPLSAFYSYYDPTLVNKMNDGTYMIVGNVDAKNLYGVRIRQEFRSFVKWKYGEWENVNTYLIE